MKRMKKKNKKQVGEGDGKETQQLSQQAVASYCWKKTSQNPNQHRIFCSQTCWYKKAWKIWFWPLCLLNALIQIEKSDLDPDVFQLLWYQLKQFWPKTVMQQINLSSYDWFQAHSHKDLSQPKLSITKKNFFFFFFWISKKKSVNENHL